MEKEEAVERVGDLVERLVKISKEEGIEGTDYDGLKKDLRKMFFKELEEKIEEPTSPSAEESVLKEVKIFEEMEKPFPFTRMGEPVEVNWDMGYNISKRGKKEYPLKIIEGEGTANADF
jgi:hypothetical protein